MSKQQQTSLQHSQATPAQLHAIFGERAQSLRPVPVLIDQAAIQAGDIDFFIERCLNIPDNAAAHLIFCWDDIDPNDAWRVLSVQRYVRAVLRLVPEVLATLCLKQRRLLRRCVLGHDTKNTREIRQSARYPLWNHICDAAGICSWE